jgi:hypothetical protein
MKDYAYEDGFLWCEPLGERIDPSKKECPIEFQWQRDDLPIRGYDDFIGGVDDDTMGRDDANRDSFHSYIKNGKPCLPQELPRRVASEIFAIRIEMHPLVY